MRSSLRAIGERNQVKLSEEESVLCIFVLWGEHDRNLMGDILEALSDRIKTGKANIIGTNFQSSIGHQTI